MAYDHTKTFENISRTVAKVNKDTMKMLVSLPEFQDQVEKIRKKYNIPPDGLKNNEESKSWHHDYLYESDERIQNWLKEVKNIWTYCKKLQHDPRYIQHIERYILFNQITAPFCNGNASMGFPAWPNMERRDFSIKVYHKLTKDELDLIMHDLERMMNRYVPSSQKKLRPKPELDRDLAVIEKTQRIGDLVVTHDGAYEYNYNDIVSEVYDTEEGDLSCSSDKKRKESLRKNKQRTEKDIKERLGWDSSS